MFITLTHVFRPGSGPQNNNNNNNNEDKLEKLILSEAKAILREGSSNSAKTSPTKEVASTPTAAPAASTFHEPMRIESVPPEKDTRLEDIVADLPSTVLSRPGTPGIETIKL